MSGFFMVCLFLLFCHIIAPKRYYRNKNLMKCFLLQQIVNYDNIISTRKISILYCTFCANFVLPNRVPHLVKCELYINSVRVLISCLAARAHFSLVGSACEFLFGAKKKGAYYVECNIIGF